MVTSVRRFMLHNPKVPEAFKRPDGIHFEEDNLLLKKSLSYWIIRSYSEVTQLPRFRVDQKSSGKSPTFIRYYVHTLVRHLANLQ